MSVRAEICRDGKRATLPADCDPQYRALIEELWQGDPDKRPSAQQVADRLYAMLNALAISDSADGRAIDKRPLQRFLADFVDVERMHRSQHSRQRHIAGRAKAAAATVSAANSNGVQVARTASAAARRDVTRVERKGSIQ